MGRSSRNTDRNQLSATMLGDSPEKTKNPLKKAMRRRNAKTVQFAAPTYVEASDYDYSSDEEENTAADAFINGTAATASNGGEVAANEHTENLSDAAATANGTHEAAPARDSASPVDDGKAASLESQGSPTMSDKSGMDFSLLVPLDFTDDFRQKLHHSNQRKPVPAIRTHSSRTTVPSLAR